MIRSSEQPVAAESIFDDVTLPDGRVGAVNCRAGLITAAAEFGPEVPAVGREVHRSTGMVALPRLVDMHVHLDKTLLGSAWYPHRTATSLAERIASEIELLEGGAVEPTDVRAARLLALAVSNGATALQSHVDVSGRLGMSRLDSVMTARDRFADRCDVVLVAFPQQGVLACPGTAAALEAAVRQGCDAVGGLDPAEFDGDRSGQLDIVFGIADRLGCRIDIHVHEAGQTGIDTLLAIAERTRVLGLDSRVNVSHGYALAQVSTDVAAETADVLAACGVSLVSSAPGSGRMPPLRLLLEHGVRVAVASDNIRDSWWPYGNADPLERACTAAYVSDFSTDEDLRSVLGMVTTVPSEILGLAPATLSVGSAADFTLVAASSVNEAVVAQPGRRVVVRAGRIVAGAQNLPRGGTVPGTRSPERTRFPERRGPTP